MSSRDNSLESNERKGLNVRSDVPALLDPQELQYTGYDNDDFNQRSGSNFDEADQSSNFEEVQNRYDDYSDRNHQRFRPGQFQERNDHGVEHEAPHGPGKSTSEQGEVSDATLLDVVEHIDDPLKHQAGSYSGYPKYQTSHVSEVTIVKLFSPVILGWKF